MTFEYNAYLRSNTIIPICILLAIVILTTWEIIGTSVKLNQKKADKYKGLRSFIMCMGICLCFMPMNVQTLFNGGIHLVYERESDAVTQTFVIEKIYEPSEEYPNFKHDHKYGADITMDGEIYFAVEAGDFKPGDTVTVTYLPKSKVILSIYYSEDSP